MAYHIKDFASYVSQEARKVLEMACHNSPFHPFKPRIMPHPIYSRTHSPVTPLCHPQEFATWGGVTISAVDILPNFFSARSTFSSLLSPLLCAKEFPRRATLWRRTHWQPRPSRSCRGNIPSRRPLCSQASPAADCSPLYGLLAMSSTPLLSCPHDYSMGFIIRSINARSSSVSPYLSYS